METFQNGGGRDDLQYISRLSDMSEGDVARNTLPVEIATQVPVFAQYPRKAIFF